MEHQRKPGTVRGDVLQTEITPVWITYEAAQHLTSLGRTTLWRLVKSGAVKSAFIGRAVRINRESLEQYIEHKAQEADSESNG
jgi:excisionase family DNA binding protein